MKKDQNSPLASVVEPLLAWYEQHRRALPWRDFPTPYHVWLSEIMLQQTRIEAVIPYYERFLSVYPTVSALAEADDEQLMKLWEGLGYYSRARNLKKAAIEIVNNHGGNLPASYEALRTLPGIGAYTAGAIASIAFGLPEPAVDGNVLRVVTRLVADERDIMRETTKRAVTASLRAVYPTKPPEAAAMTQALMELGERVCIPSGKPHCDMCPLGASCLARQRDLTDRIPVRSPKKPRRIEQKTVFLLLCGDRVALVKRPDTGLLAGLWEFPSADAYTDATTAAAHLTECGTSLTLLTRGVDATHIFTHIEWHMQSYVAVCNREITQWNGRALTYATLRELTEQYAVPTAYRAFVRALAEFLSPLP